MSTDRQRISAVSILKQLGHQWNGSEWVAPASSETAPVEASIMHHAVQHSRWTKTRRPADDWGAVRDRLREAGFDYSVAAMKARRKTIQAAVNPKARDGRSLRATGRTEQLNFKARRDVRDALYEHVGRGGISLWLEEAILAKLKAEGVDGV